MTLVILVYNFSPSSKETLQGMTSLLQSLSTLNVCKSLVIASVIWIVILLAFYFSLEPADIQNIEMRKLEVEYLNINEIEHENVNVKGAMSPTAVNVDVSLDNIQKLEEEPERRSLSIRNIMTTISNSIVLQLGLKNPGENGEAVILKNVSEEIQNKINRGWELHQFNEFVSELIALNRSLPDPRDVYCKQSGLYLDTLPSTSVIIIFHNEAWTTLLRSVDSVLARSPEHLVKEIILVDDFSNMRKTLLNDL